MQPILGNFHNNYYMSQNNKRGNIDKSTESLQY